jgi:hypothetical protein
MLIEQSNGPITRKPTRVQKKQHGRSNINISFQLRIKVKRKKHVTVREYIQIYDKDILLENEVT